jgi:hypothetical protein
MEEIHIIFVKQGKEEHESPKKEFPEAFSRSRSLGLPFGVL